MRRLFLAFVLIAAPLAAHADGFVPGTEDLPLMPGLVSVAGSAVVFDKPEGRIVESAARGKVSRYTVARFYNRTLPQLGWRPATGAPVTWTRAGERLHLDFHGPDGNLTVGFTISPQ